MDLQLYILQPKKVKKKSPNYLLKKGADVNSISVHNETPLDLVARDETKIAALLRKHGGKTAVELKAADN